jgi:hypothetical protein
MTQVERSGVDQCVSAGTECSRKVTRIVAVKYDDPGATLDELLRRSMTAPMGDRNIPSSGKKILCHGTAYLPGSTQDEGAA